MKIKGVFFKYLNTDDSLRVHNRRVSRLEHKVFKCFARSSRYLYIAGTSYSKSRENNTQQKHKQILKVREKFIEECSYVVSKQTWKSNCIPANKNSC